MSCRLILEVAVSKREMYSPVIEKKNQTNPYLNKGALYPIDELLSSGLAIFVSDKIFTISS